MVAITKKQSKESSIVLKGPSLKLVFQPDLRVSKISNRGGSSPDELQPSD